MRWLFQYRSPIAIILGIIVLIVAGIWFWEVLVGYIDPKSGPKGITNRKDVVQVFALIVAGVVGLIGGIVGIANLSVAQRNLQQQTELEEQRRQTAGEIEDRRSQDAALQAYFEQMGDLLTDHNLIDTDRRDIQQLALAQTLTVLARLDGPRKGALVRFLHGAELISTSKTIIRLTGANLRGAKLIGVDLVGAKLSRGYLSNANLHGANLRDTNFVFADLVGAKLTGADLRGAKLIGADLSDADLSDADLGGADLSDAKVTEDQLAACKSLSGATMTDGSKRF
jgi:uncharacterized protein YjbI with pentapeptide repeats